MKRSPRTGRTRAGFTLIETMVALTLMGAIGYGIVLAINVGQRSQVSVSELSAGDHALRATTSSLIDELGSTNDAHITVTVLGDGNHQLDFEMPIDVGTTADWGVHERALGPGNEDHAGWKLRYTVKNVEDTDGTDTKTLVRQIVDDANVVRREASLIDGLRAGTDTPPGFRVVKSGVVWVVTLSTSSRSGAGSGLREVFHVHARN